VRRAGRVGSPEQPLSNLGELLCVAHTGLLSFRDYWASAVHAYLARGGDTISLRDMGSATGIAPEDLVGTLQALGLVKYWRGTHVVVQASEAVVPRPHIAIGAVLPLPFVSNLFFASSTPTLSHSSTPTLSNLFFASTPQPPLLASSTEVTTAPAPNDRAIRPSQSSRRVGLICLLLRQHRHRRLQLAIGAHSKAGAARRGVE
jgi:hypothetical protein